MLSIMRPVVLKKKRESEFIFFGQTKNTIKEEVKIKTKPQRVLYSEITNWITDMWLQFNLVKHFNDEQNIFGFLMQNLIVFVNCCELYFWV